MLKGSPTKVEKQSTSAISFVMRFKPIFDHHTRVAYAILGRITI